MENYIVSARKYRPASFDSVVGQKALTATLKNAVATNRLANSYLFCGSRGVGKTSCARIFAKTINCTNPTPQGEACNECDSCRDFNNGVSLNVIELDAASNNGVEDIRQLTEQVQMRPTNGRYRVFIIDEVHMLSSQAFNAFLKTLEEPPSYVIFILATTEKHKIIPTILSRCQIFDFKRITVQDIMDHLSFVAESEGIEAEPAALNVIARKADGAMRDALSIFDQVAASSRGKITYRSAIENLNVLDSNYYNRLLDCFLQGRVLDTWLIYKEIRDHGFDSHFFINGLGDYLRDLMVAIDPSTISLLETDEETRASLAERARNTPPEFILKAMALCNDADFNYRSASNKQFLIELTLAKICQLLSPSQDNSGKGEGHLRKISAAASTPTSQSPASEHSPSSAHSVTAQAAPSGKSEVSSRSATTQQPSVATPAPGSGGSATLSQPVQTPAAFSEPPAPAYETSKQSAPSSFKQSNRGTSAASVHPQMVTGKKTLKPRNTFSIANAASHDNAASAQTPSGNESSLRSESYTPETLRKVWQDFINANPSQHILINTMRASFPIDKGDDTYCIMVENEMQRSVVEQTMPQLLKFVRDALKNDRFKLTIELNQGSSSPHTWNEREVYDHMLQSIPQLRGFVDDLGLTLG